MRSFLLLLALSACGKSSLPVRTIVVDTHSVNVEVAALPDTRATGLMNRDSMPADEGMLFVYPNEAPRSFWMKNTRIPLDIFYFDADLRLVSVSENARPCKTQRCPTYPSKGPAKYVLELNAGKAAELGARIGDVLELKLD